MFSLALRFFSFLCLIPCAELDAKIYCKNEISSEMFVCLFHVSQPFVHFEVLTYIEVSCYHSATSDLLQTIDHETIPGCGNEESSPCFGQELFSYQLKEVLLSLRKQYIVNCLLCSE